jgi:hypothetical protein
MVGFFLSFAGMEGLCATKRGNNSAAFFDLFQNQRSARPSIQWSWLDGRLPELFIDESKIVLHFFAARNPIP